MPNWNEIFELVQPLNSLEQQKQKYFKELVEYTGRNTVVYFSCWQQKVGVLGPYSIDDDDRNGFMSVFHKLDKEMGLDLILHTPGGDSAATQSIVNYLYNFFNGDIRVIVPHTAMSAGTMIACSAKEIILAKHSNLGPFDPQINNVPAHEYLKMVKDGLDAINNNQNVSYWREILSKYPPTFLGICQNAIKSSKIMVSNWLERSMLTGDKQKIERTVNYLSDYNYHLLHNNRLDIETLRKATDLKIVELESDQRLQDYILTLYHCYQISSASTNSAKIIENQNGIKFIKNVFIK